MRRAVAVVAVVASTLVVGEPPAFGARDLRAEWPVGLSIVSDHPFADREGFSVAVRDRFVYLIGGRTVGGERLGRWKSDGVVFDLRTRRSRRLPRVPFRRAVFGSPQWVGDELVVVGTTCPGRPGDEHECSKSTSRTIAAVYSRERNAWRRLRVPPAAGSRPLFSTRRESVRLADTRAVAVAPRTGRWRSIPGTVSNVAGTACAAERYAAAAQLDANSITAGVMVLGRRARTWTPSPRAPGPSVPAPFPIACSEDSVVFYDSDLSSVTRYQIGSRRWSQVAPPVERPSNFALGVGHGRFVDFFPASEQPGFRLTTATGHWSRIAPGWPELSRDFSLGGIHWTHGLAVTTEDNGSAIVVYRPR